MNDREKSAEAPAHNPRYNLLCRTLQATPDHSDPLFAVQEQLDRLDTLINRELLELARQASPDDFADVYLDFTRELHRFREFAAYPHLAQKTVVAFGGAFSAGKSSLINALLGQQVMVVEVDPTTALPAYVLAGEQDAIYGLNLHRLRVALSEDEFASLTHDEKNLYGSEVSRSMSAAFVVRENFPWPNLAFLDTPGYSGQSQVGGRTDASIAAAQLNSAHVMVWVVNAKQGTLPETDIDFLARLDASIPKLVVLSRADQLNDRDRAAVVERIASTLATRNLPVLGVWPVSAHPRHKGLLAPVMAQLQDWGQEARAQAFARRFKSLFVRYQRGLERERKHIQWQRNRLNRLQLLATGDVLDMADELSLANAEKNQLLDSVAEQLAGLRTRFFAELKRVGHAVGMVLPEPHEVDLLEMERSNLLDALVALREQAQQPEPDVLQPLTVLRQKGPVRHRARLLRRAPQPHRASLAALMAPAEAIHRAYLLRRTPRAREIELATLLTTEVPAHRQNLLRRTQQSLMADSLAVLCQ